MTYTNTDTHTYTHLCPQKTIMPRELLRGVWEVSYLPLRFAGTFISIAGTQLGSSLARQARQQYMCVRVCVYTCVGVCVPACKYVYTWKLSLILFLIGSCNEAHTHSHKSVAPDSRALTLLWLNRPHYNCNLHQNYFTLCHSPHDFTSKLMWAFVFLRLCAFICV